MQSLRDVFRGSLARSLRTLTEEDRLAAALPLVCGSALAGHCTVARLSEDRVLYLQVDGAEWFSSVLPMREVLRHDLQRVAGVALAGVHFDQAGTAPDRPLRSERFSGRAQTATGRQSTGHASIPSRATSE